MSDSTMDRRAFLQASAVAAGAGVAMSAFSRSASAETFSPLRIAVQYGKLPKDKPFAEQFAFAKSLGFDGVESGVFGSIEEAKQAGDAAKAAGAPIHSVLFGGWDTPLSDTNEKRAEKGKDAIANALRIAQAAGADTLLVVPGVVTDKVRYIEAYERSQKWLRELLPVAEETKVVIAVENVWNKFLLSPLEFAKYVDEFESPWLQAYFDIANNILYGFAEDWIRTLGKRIRAIHIKDFTRNGSKWNDLPYEGDVNWPECRKALAEVGFEGWLTEEFGKSDEEHLRELARRMRLFSEGAEKA